MLEGEKSDENIENLQNIEKSLKEIKQSAFEAEQWTLEAEKRAKTEAEKLK